MNLLELIVGGSRAGKRSTHHECRDCGRNVSSHADTCPECGGGIAVYSL